MISTIYLAGGCFWGIEHLMKALPGVLDTAVGYANGSSAADATYERVCAGDTGFRETVCVRYDAQKISLDHVLYALFEVINPELRNQQGNDCGEQYQAGVYWEPDDAQSAATVQRIFAHERARYPHFAVESKELENFFEAEQYHQDYLDKNPGGYCHVPLGVIRQLSQITFDENYYK